MKERKKEREEEREEGKEEEEYKGKGKEGKLVMVKKRSICKAVIAVG